MRSIRVVMLDPHIVRNVLFQVLGLVFQLPIQQITKTWFGETRLSVLVVISTSNEQTPMVKKGFGVAIAGVSY